MSEFSPTASTSKTLPAIDSAFVDLFVDAVKLIGLPPSAGQIYGVLFVSREPLALDDLVDRLQISKGSASQGLRLLHQLGAIVDEEVEGERRTYYRVEDNLRRLVGGFIREEIRPHLDSGKSKIDLLFEMSDAEENEEDKAFYRDRAIKTRRWVKQAKRLLPFLQKVLGE